MKLEEMFLNYIPDIYLNEPNTMKLIKIWSDLFEDITNIVDDLPKYFYIDSAPIEYLKILGSNIGLEYIYPDNVETYRSLVKLRYYNTFIVPTHNNLLRITKKVTNGYSIIKPLWEIEGLDFENDNTDLAYSVIYDIDVDFPTVILEEINRFFPAGVKLIIDYLIKFEQKEMLVATINYDNDIISIVGENGFISDKIMKEEQLGFIESFIIYDNDYISIGFKKEAI